MAPCKVYDAIGLHYSLKLYKKNLIKVLLCWILSYFVAQHSDDVRDQKVRFFCQLTSNCSFNEIYFLRCSQEGLCLEIGIICSLEPDT